MKTLVTCTGKWLGPVSLTRNFRTKKFKIENLLDAFCLLFIRNNNSKIQIDVIGTEMSV